MVMTEDILVDEHAAPCSMAVALSPKKFIVADENAPPLNMSIMPSPGKFSLLQEVAALSPRIMSSPDKLSLQEKIFPLSPKVMASPGKLSLQEEMTALSPKVMSSPGLFERGLKRTADLVLSGAEKVRHIIKAEGNQQDTARMNLDTEALADKDELSQLKADEASVTLDMHNASPQPVLKPKCLDLEDDSIGFVDTCQAANGDALPEVESLTTLKSPETVQQPERLSLFANSACCMDTCQPEYGGEPPAKWIRYSPAQMEVNLYGCMLYVPVIQLECVNEAKLQLECTTSQDHSVRSVDALPDAPESQKQHAVPKVQSPLSLEAQNGEAAAKVESLVLLESERIDDAAEVQPWTLWNPLDTYKTIMDATVVLRNDFDNEEGDAWEASVEEDRTCIGECPSSVEWEDPATGVMMGYAPSKDCNDDEVEQNAVSASTADMALCGEATDETAAPLQITVAWKEPATGALLGYAFCEEGDEDVQAMHCLFHEQDADALDGVDTAETCSDDVNSTCACPREADKDGVDNCSEAKDAIGQTTVVETDALTRFEDEWKDPASGVVMAYECDEDSEFGELLEMKPQEWEDTETGTMLGYAPCDEGSEDYADDESDFGEDVDLSNFDECRTKTATVVETRMAQKHRVGSRKRRFVPLALRLRKQHVKRVLKCKRMRS